MNKPERPSSQAKVFLDGEADAYFQRNIKSRSEARNDPWNAEIANFLSPGDRVLEIGCSDARRLAAIEAMIDGCHFAGVDPSALAIQEARGMYPHFDLQVGTAHDTGFAETFDLLIFGFCLYLCDRDKLLQSVAHADQLLSDGGCLVIIDFDPPHPMKRSYIHHRGLWSYKMDYSSLFSSLPEYNLILKGVRAFKTAEEHQPIEPGERVGLWILRKDETNAYAEEYAP